MTVLDRVLAKAGSLIERRNVLGQMLDPDYVSRINSDSLLFYSGNVHSQRGQDGILAEIFRRIGIRSGVFVEFGAWDGVYLSNCRYLFERSWGGAFIEGDTRKHRELAYTYRDYRNVKTINAMVGAPGLPGEPLDTLLRGAGLDPAGVDFVSIDVDGPDLEIFQAMTFSPAVILIEGGFNFSPDLRQPLPLEVARRNMQQPLQVIVSTAADRGYRAVCFYQDTYLVREDLAGPFPVLDARALYANAFNFMPDAYRKGLLQLRAASSVIRQYESEFFGHFSADPLAYRVVGTSVR